MYNIKDPTNDACIFRKSHDKNDEIKNNQKHIVVPHECSVYGTVMVSFDLVNQHFVPSPSTLGNWPSEEKLLHT
jgi:hypothetical protein